MPNFFKLLDPEKPTENLSGALTLLYDEILATGKLTPEQGAIIARARSQAIILFKDL